jgi:hypothetical protein
MYNCIAWSTVIIEKLIMPERAQKFPAFYEIQQFSNDSTYCEYGISPAL